MPPDVLTAIRHFSMTDLKQTPAAAGKTLRDSDPMKQWIDAVQQRRTNISSGQSAASSHDDDWADGDDDDNDDHCESEAMRSRSSWTPSRRHAEYEHMSLINCKLHRSDEQYDDDLHKYYWFKMFTFLFYQIKNRNFAT